MIGTFWLDGIASTRYGIILRSPPPIVTPERDVETVAVPGKSGDVHFDKGRFKNISVPYKCALLPKNGAGFRVAAAEVATFLESGARYKRLINNYDPHHFRMARVANPPRVESIVEQAGSFEIAFDCKPQRYRRDGEKEYEATRPIVLNNPTDCPALPLITVYGNGPGVLTVGPYRCNVLNINQWLRIDSETESANKGVEDMNEAVEIANYPVLKKGKTRIEFDGGITKIIIKPRWWTL